MKDLSLTSLTENDQSLLMLNSAKDLARTKLQGFAQSQDFEKDIALAFGQVGNADKLRSIWLTGELSFPTIELRTKTELGGAHGAFSQVTGKIYLSQELINSNSLDLVLAVLLEEYGHYVDTQLNTTDSLGDEGAIFSSLVQRKTFEAEQLQQLQAKDDTAVVAINGQGIQIEQASVSDSGGEGGVTKTLTLDPLPQGQIEQSITLNYSYEHYSIPDQFEVRYAGQSVFNTGGLVSGSKDGSITFKQVQGQDSLNIVVTAPQSGTAWDFSVSTDNAEVEFDGLVGDVIKLDLGQQSGNLTLKSTPDASRGKLIDEKGENATVGTVYKTLYYVPTVNGAISNYGQDKQHLGVGKVTFNVEDQNQKSITVGVNVTDGFSTSGDNIVKTGTGKLDIYTQQQRLAYLGFPGSSGDPLIVDGATRGNTKWAIKMFNVATNPATQGRGTVATQGDKFFKAYINSANAPKWQLLTTVPKLTISAGSGRNYGMDHTGDITKNTLAGLTFNLISTGAARNIGTAPPSTSHDGGRGIDIDDVPGNFFKSNGLYVASPGGKIIVTNGTSYQAADPKNIPNGFQGLKTTVLASTTTETMVKAVKDLLDYSLDRTKVEQILNAFKNAGSGTILYNDPRFLGTHTKFRKDHFNHIHISINSSVATGATQKSKFSSLSFSSKDLFANDITSANVENSTGLVSALLLANSSLENAIDLEAFEGDKNLTGLINSANPEQYYRVALGNPVSTEEDEEAFFPTLRTFSLLLNGLSDDVDVELIADYNRDGIRQDEEVVASSEQIGNSPESINFTDLPEDVYYIRVFQNGGDTGYSLSLSIPPLPVPPDNAGNSPNNAQNLGILTGNLTRSDFIGTVDPDDYYRFDLDKVGNFSAQVNGLDQGNLVVYLGQDIDNDETIDFDEIIAISEEAEGNEPGVININGLATGTYYLWLSRSSGNTDYNLNLLSTPSVIPVDKAGSTLATAFDLGTLSASIQNDFVGNVDSIDYYRFTLTNPSGVTLNLSGLSADADLELSQDKDGDGKVSPDEIIQLSEGADNQDEKINIMALPAGDYFVKVSQYEGDTTYNLALTPTTATGVDLEVTVTPITTPLTLGENVNYTVTVKNIGASTATEVILKDNLPLANVLNVSAVASKGFANVFSNEISVNLGTLNANESATLSVSGELIGSGSISSLIQASSTDTVYNPSNDSLVQRFSVAPGTIQPADLELSLTSDKTTVDIDDLVTLRLTLTNKGPGAATSIQVKNVLPKGLTFVSSSPQQGSYDAVSGIWDVGNIAKDNQAFIDIVTKVTSGGSLFNTAEVIAVAETDPDSTPSNNNPNEDDQASVALNAALAIPSLIKIADDIFTISGGAAGKPKLQITISDFNLKSVNDFAVFTVDDAQGRINGIAPTEAGYTQAALSLAKNIFSAIANLPNGFDPKTLSRSLEFNSSDNLRFLLIKNDTLDNVRKKNVSNPDILFSNANNQKITDSGTGNFALAWKDGSGNNSDFKDFVVNIQPTDTPLPLGSNLQDQQEGEVLDLRSVDSTKTVQANFVVNREAAYNNFVGFYKITDSQGTIADPLTGLSLKPGDSGYAEAAIKNRIAGIDLQAANQSTATINGVFQGGSIFAPFIVVNGSPDQLLDTNKSNDPAVYFAYLGANSDGIDHIRLLGNNTFGFEDLPVGGDLDYNDIIIRVNLSVI